MKKIVAAFFLFLISFTLLSHHFPLENSSCATEQELPVESSEGDMENKHDKKEIKEFTSALHKEYSTTTSLSIYREQVPSYYAPPTLTRPAPPPDPAC